MKNKKKKNRPQFTEDGELFGVTFERRVIKKSTNTFRPPKVKPVVESKVVPMYAAEVYTDGSCRTGAGGWAFVSRLGRTIAEDSGYSPKTTSNRMEMLAAIKALQSLPDNTKVTVYSDSEYLVNGMNVWLRAWKNRGWTTAGGSHQPIKNKDLWEQLELEGKNRQVEYVWVRGHNGTEFNERADYLATRASRNVVS
jgi:ribonuclease HI